MFSYPGEPSPEVLFEKPGGGTGLIIPSRLLWPESNGPDFHGGYENF